MYAQPISAEAAVVRATIERELVDPEQTVAEQRQQWETAVAGTPLPDGVDESVTDVGGVPCRVLTPRRDTGSTTLVYAHGGGFTTGSSLTHRAWGARLALAVPATVVLVDYRRPPEHPFPAPVDDVVAVAAAVLGDQRPDDPAGRVLLAGDSSGAALAVAAAIVLRDSGGRQVRGTISVSGAFDATLVSPSIDSGRDPQLDRTVLEHWQAQLAACAGLALDDPRLSPLFADTAHLPPMLLLAGTHDVWCDDSVRLAARVHAAGGSAELDVADHMWHCWPMWGEFPEANAAVVRIARWCSTTTLRTNDGPRTS